MAGSPEKVKRNADIVERYAKRKESGETIWDIADEYNISDKRVYAIVRRQQSRDKRQGGK